MQSSLFLLFVVFWFRFSLFWKLQWLFRGCRDFGEKTFGQSFLNVPILFFSTFACSHWLVPKCLSAKKMLILSKFLVTQFPPNFPFYKDFLWKPFFKGFQMLFQGRMLAYTTFYVQRHQKGLLKWICCYLPLVFPTHSSEWSNWFPPTVSFATISHVSCLTTFQILEIGWRSCSRNLGISIVLTVDLPNLNGCKFIDILIYVCVCVCALVHFYWWIWFDSSPFLMFV